MFWMDRSNEVAGLEERYSHYFKPSGEIYSRTGCWGLAMAKTDPNGDRAIGEKGGLVLCVAKRGKWGSLVVQTRRVTSNLKYRPTPETPCCKPTCVKCPNFPCRGI